MATTKRKRREKVDDETILRQAQETAFEAAFFVLEDVDNDSFEQNHTINDIVSSEPATKKRRLGKVTSNGVAAAAELALLDTTVDSRHANKRVEGLADLDGAVADHARKVDSSEAATIPSTSSGANVMNMCSSECGEPLFALDSTGVDDDTTRKGNITRNDQSNSKKLRANTKKRSILRVPKRVHALVIQNAPLDICHLQQLYQDCFGEVLNFKSLGFGKLKSFVASIPSIDIKMVKSKCMLSSSSLSPESPEQIVNEAGVIVDSQKVYGCLVCGEQSTVYGRVLEHMQQCCPEKCKLPKLQQKCTIGHKKCAVPDCAKTASKPKVLTAAEETCKLHGCLGCSDLQGEWNHCMRHMKQCCPELIVECAGNAFQRRCTLGDELCAVPGHEQGDDDDRYGCLHCGELQCSWRHCLEHMKGCCPSSLVAKEGLLWKCRLEDDKCEVPTSVSSRSVRLATTLQSGAASCNEEASVEDACMLEYKGDGSQNGGENQCNQRGYPHPKKKSPMPQETKPLERDPLAVIENKGEPVTQQSRNGARRMVGWSNTNP
jgi:hypothetical protein